MIKTSEQRTSDLMDAVESFDLAEQEGKVLSRATIATLCTRLTEATVAIRVAESGYRVC